MIRTLAQKTGSDTDWAAVDRFTVDVYLLTIPAGIEALPGPV